MPPTWISGTNYDTPSRCVSPCSRCHVTAPTSPHSHVCASPAFSGEVAAVARYDDEVEWAKDHGVDIAFNVYAGAGLELADQVAGNDAPEPVQPADDGSDEVS